MVIRRRSRDKIYLNENDKADLLNFRKEEARRKQKRDLTLRKFARTRTGRVSRIVSNIPQQFNRGRVSVGRPKGSYDKRYASSGGVYGYRKMLTAQLREQRFQQIRENTLTPEQQQLLAQQKAQQQARAINPENRTIPIPNARFDFRNIFREIEEASNIAG